MEVGTVGYPTINTVLYIQGGCLGFLNHQQYVRPFGPFSGGGGERYVICQGALQSCLPMPELRGWAVLQALRDLEEGEEAAENWWFHIFLLCSPQKLWK